MAEARKRYLLVVAMVLHGFTNNAIAGTSTYVTSGPLTKTIHQCLDQMRFIAMKTGFITSQQTVMDDNGKAGDFHADRSDSSLHFTARCNSISKTWGVAVSGTSNNETFSQYDKLYDLLP